MLPVVGVIIAFVGRSKLKAAAERESENAG
jgi:hypothetical protein